MRVYYLWAGIDSKRTFCFYALIHMLTKIIKISIFIFAMVLFSLKIISCERPTSSNANKTLEKNPLSKLGKLVESKEHPEGIYHMTMGGVTYNLPAKFWMQNPPNRDFFSFYAVWTEWGDILATKEFKSHPKANPADYPDNLIQILITGNVQNGQAYEQWKYEQREHLERRISSEYPGLDALPSRNGRVLLYISKDETFGLQGNTPLVFPCGPVPLRTDSDVVGCVSTFKLDPATYVEYRFSSYYLGKWREIYTSVREFLLQITSKHE